MDYPVDFSSLVGIPYSEKNCWHLMRDFYMLSFQVELKHYFDEMPKNRESIKTLIYTHLGDFERVEGQPMFGDLMMLKIKGVESHIAAYVGGGKMLHSSKTTGSCLDHVYKWRHLIHGYYRLNRNRN